jgi:hypothetical protein
MATHLSVYLIMAPVVVAACVSAPGEGSAPSSADIHLGG